MYLNLDEAIERRIRLEKNLKNFGLYKNLFRLSAPKFGNHETLEGLRYGIRKGTATGRIEMLNTLSKKKLPFLLLEDDVVAIDKNKIIEVPEDADAIHLSLTNHGITTWNPGLPDSKNTNSTVADFMEEGKIVYSKVDSKISKLGSMYGGQSILYISERYYDHSMWIYEKALELDVDYDKIACLTMPFFNIYALNNPIFIADSQPKEINYGLN